MHSKTLISNPIPTTNQDQDHDFINSTTNSLNSNSNSNSPSEDRRQIFDQFQEFDDVDQSEIVVDNEPESKSGGLRLDINNNNPPDSFWVGHNNVTDWLNGHHTFIERKTSVKLVPASRKFESNQTRTSQRSVSFNNQPQATIIGFRQKPFHSYDGKVKQTDRQDNLLLFKNRSVPGKNSGLPVTEPRSPRVSCMGRVGSMRGRARRTGFWKKVKTAILNRVRGKDR